MLKSAILDADGCIINWKAANASIHFQVTGHRPSIDLRNKILGKNPHDAWTIIRDHYKLEESVESLLARRNAILNKMFPKMDLYPGVSDLLDYLNSRKIPYAITSSVSEEDTKLKLSGYPKIIENAVSLICAKKDTPAKPDPQLYLDCLKQTSFDPSKTLIIEDSVPGIVAAQKSGCKTAFICDSTYTTADEMLQKFNTIPDFRYASLKDMKYAEIFGE